MIAQVDVALDLAVKIQIFAACEFTTDLDLICRCAPRGRNDGIAGAGFRSFFVCNSGMLGVDAAAAGWGAGCAG